MSIPKQDERTPGGKNAPSIVEVARRGWDAARRSAKMTGLSSCGPWEELPKEMRDALTQVATEGWLQGTREGQDWARKGSYDNAPTDPHHGGKIFNAYGSTDDLREALKAAEQFIVNGVECGFIRMPDPPDSALDTLPKIRAALSGSPHASDCAVHNGPALPAGECDCDVSGSPAPSTEGLREWQPIETAPKDGTEVLVFRDDCGVLLARWTSAGELLTDAEAEASGMDEDALHQEDWFYADIMRGGRMEGIEVPTHWMPLPPAPDAARTALAGVTAPSEVDAK